MVSLELLMLTVLLQCHMFPSKLEQTSVLMEHPPFRFGTETLQAEGKHNIERKRYCTVCKLHKIYCTYSD